ncbi:hypothetical protein CO151_02420 [bacterium CG_4_9_14_3_um_filter_65_15]|nr:MAG: hypothetical protein CO151_02420 [bacterium CG_4_9_14_3_um_filter_65_15]
MGCGIGCGLILIILGGLGTCSYFTVKKFKTQADDLEVVQANLQDQFGEATEFVPDPDGAIDPGRMEVFLAVRDSLALPRRELGELLTTLDGDAGFIDKAKAGLNLVPSVLGFAGQRNRVLLNLGMGVGEYQYIYTLSYYVFLAKDPGDGPGFVLAGDDHDDDGGAVHMNWGGHGDTKDVRRGRSRRVRSFVNQMQTPILANQWQAFTATLPGDSDPEADPWGVQLAAELAAMRTDPRRIPWPDELPDPIRASLEPYRDRLDASYDPETSIVEMGLAEED